MDVEAHLRRELIEALGPSFLCFEEIDVEHAVLAGQFVRADVVAVPVDDAFWSHALAFEVKSHAEDAGYGKWSTAIKQASDYVLGRIRSDNHNLSGRRVSASFVFPAPHYLPYVPRENAPADISNRVMIAGAFHCATHWRVGRAWRAERDGLTLSFGPNELWTARRGFTADARNLLQNKRRLGSRSVDVATLLDGLSAPMPEFE